jgi:O-antigen ligase
MGLWGMAVIHLGFAAYLMQVIPGRERLAFGALAGALVVECLVALGQWAWVLPQMAAALAGGDPAIAALENASGDLANRVAYGGLFGTFTLANTLAAFLLLAAVPFAGVLTTGRGRQRLIAAAVIALAVIVAIGTASKGAAVALILAGALVWTLHVQGRLRWLALIAVAIGGITIAAVPALRDLGATSAEVRLGYWQGATRLIAEAPLLGHGINGFAAHGGRTMPLDAEPTRHVHNDVLEATVDGGVLAGLALIALLGWCARRRLTTAKPLIADAAETNRTWQAAWPLVLIFPLFSALGMLASNLEWWPLGSGEMTWWLWPLLLSAVAIAVAVLSARLPLPPTWAWQLALAAFTLHCLVDFNLQSPAIWGTLIVVALLAGGRVYAIGVCNISRSVVLILVVLCLGGLVLGIGRSGQLNLAINQLRFSNDPATQPAERSQIGLAVHGIALRWPADADLTVAALRQVPPGVERITHSTYARMLFSWNPSVDELVAQDLMTLGDAGAAGAAGVLRSAIETNPAFLPRRQRLVELCERAALLVPSQRDLFLQLAQAERQRIAELTPIVHPRNRLKPASSALPIQPAP